LLAFLETTNAENSCSLEFNIKPAGDPEELYTPEKYIQEYDVSIRYERTELGSCTAESIWKVINHEGHTLDATRTRAEAEESVAILEHFPEYRGRWP
jgi:hypothetical protein